MTTKELKERFPHASKAFLAANYQAGSAIPHSKPQQDKASALGGAKEGEGNSMGRIDVGFTLQRTRLLDPDNAVGSIKDLLDGCRRAKLIPEDNPEVIALSVSQERVKTRAEEKTIITITYP